eukprot:scaffold133395_cov15-Tisochrysis_lutea.AAC.1
MHAQTGEPGPGSADMPVRSMDGLLIAVRSTTVAPEKEHGQGVGDSKIASNQAGPARGGKRGGRSHRLSPVINYTLHRLNGLLNWQVGVGWARAAVGFCRGNAAVVVRRDDALGAWLAAWPGAWPVVIALAEDLSKTGSDVGSATCWPTGMACVLGVRTYSEPLTACLQPEVGNSIPALHCWFPPPVPHTCLCLCVINPGAGGARAVTTQGLPQLHQALCGRCQHLAAH